MNQDLIFTGSAVFLNDNFTDAELIDTISNRIHSLIDGLLTICLLLGGLQTHRVRIRYLTLG